MGSLISRQNVGVEEVDISVSHAYKYPPKSGNYFSSHFIMGGERFDTAQPEMYLFGENVDLNFLGSRPAPFPYPAPSASEPSRTLKAVVNIRKESLRFVRVPDESLNLKEPETRSLSTTFNIEFIFDCDVRCAITIMYFCSEEVTSMGLMYTPRDPSMNSETYHYKRGANQQFSQVCHTFDPSKFSEESLLYSFDREIMPIVIYCIAEEGEEPYQSHATIAVVEKHSDGYTLKPLKQKLFVDGLCYLLQEIYGIENKNTDSKVVTDDDPDDNGAECVICMCDLRDTLILPCRHLCLCNCCADSLRYQANNCPICRVPFRALLQIKALQKLSSNIAGGAPSTNTESGETIPAGYESVSLIEALNGPSVAPQQPPAPPYQNMYVQLPQNATDRGLDGSTEDGENAREYEDRYNTFKGSSLLEDSMTQTDRPSNPPEPSETVSKGVGTQMRMSVLMAQESEDSLEGRSEASPSPSSTASRKDKTKFVDDSCSRIGESRGPKDGGERSARRKSKKSNPQSPTLSTEMKENVLCGKPDDDEEIVETLRLLEQKPEGAGDKSGEIASLQEASAAEFKSQEALTDSPESLSYDVENPSAEDEKTNEPSSTRDIDEYSISMTEYESPRSQIQPACESEFNPGKRKERRSSKKAKQKGLGHKHRNAPASATATAYNPLHCSETTAVGDDSISVLVPENQSLPGTPLSHSSAVSRSSDASVSSASSTRALILSHPTQSSTVI